MTQTYFYEQAAIEHRTLDFISRDKIKKKGQSTHTKE